MARMEDGGDAREELISLLRKHSLVLGDVTLSSGKKTTYYIDARRTVMRPDGQRAAGELIARHATDLGARAVGGPVMAAIPLACAAISVPEGRDLVGFFVRKERKEHGLQRWVEGGTEPGDRVLVVEDTVTTGGSTVSAIERIRDEGFEIAGVLSLVDRLVGGGEAIAAAAGAPYEALTTIDDVFPDRPDR
jgi:orotate phosphoribosyltransferase